MPPKRHWQDMTSLEFEDPDIASWVAVLPIAAIEQHGPHLPVGTDALIGQAHLARILERAPADLPFTLLPMQCVGKSNEHIASPGTLTLSWDTLAHGLLDLGASVARAGVRRLVFANSHGGNIATLEVVARELRVRHGMLAVSASFSRVAGLPEALYGARERAFGIHGGDMETSILLAYRPDLVRQEHARDFVSAQEGFAQRFTHLRAHGTSAFGWVAQDLSPFGAVGDASAATAEKGHATLDHGAEAFLALLQDVARFDLNALATLPEGLT